jgi:hypothetical protein
MIHQITDLAEGQLCQALIAAEQVISQAAALDVSQISRRESSRFGSIPSFP